MKKHAADYFAAIVEGERLDSAIVEGRPIIMK
jgi:hypothetical protein